MIRIEPIGGDSTRDLPGSGAGYFPMYNRNKKSLCLDLKSSEGLGIAQRLCGSADVIVENFRAGTMEKLGLGCDWGEVVIAAQLACAPAQTTEDGGGGARKRSRVLDEPLRAARAPAVQGDDPELGSVGEQLTELRVASTRA